MDRQNPYFRQVELLVKVLPLINGISCFALKGGTAINLFYRDMPRLSVDIDLVYVPINDRITSLENMKVSIKKLGGKVNTLIPQAKIHYSFMHNTNYVNRLIIEADRAVVKIEVSPVLRGTVYNPEIKRIRSSVENVFGFVEVPIVSFEDLFAGKILAALDRQHPRDLFDIKGLLEKEGITETLKEAFIVYLISHNRRFIEILNPTPHNIEWIFKTDFDGMSTHRVSVVELTKARADLIVTINNLLNERDKQFLLDFKMGRPDWSFFSVSHIKDLPAVKWKLHNLNQIEKTERQLMVDNLKNYFQK